MTSGMKVKLNMTFEEIFEKLDRHELVIVHMKETMIPMIYDPFDKQLYDMPEGYMAYDKHHFFKKI